MNPPIDEDDSEFDPTVTSWFVPLGQKTSVPVESPAPNSKARSRQLHELSLMLHRPEESDHERQWVKPAESNQRQYSRCPIPEENAPAKLIISGRKFLCRLVELSIGGFGVVVPGDSKLSAGAIGQLSAPGLNYIVSVSRQEERPDGLYVGLKQIEEVLDDHPFSRSNGSSPLGYAIAAFAGALIATTAYFFMRGH